MIKLFEKTTLSLFTKDSLQTFVGLATLFVFVSNAVVAQEKLSRVVEEQAWSQFLGPNRNGLSSETGLLDSFQDKQPVEVWRQPMVGGLSGIAIKDKHLLTLAQSEGQQWLIALDPVSGKQLWKTAIGQAYQNPMGNGPRSTPTIDDDVAFVYTGEGILVAVRVSDGQIAWSKNLPKDLQCKPSEYGMSCSPLVYESMVIVHVGGMQGAVVACDKKTGKQVWKTGAGDAGYSSPVLMILNSTIQVVSFIGNQVLGIEPTTGQMLWSYPFETEFGCNTACPVQVGNSVLISSGENHGSALLELERTTDDWKVSEVWKSLGSISSLRSEWQTPVLLDGCLYGFDNVGNAGPVSHLTCIDVATGKAHWKKLRFGKGNLIAADGKLILSTVAGELVLAKASKVAYQELGRKPVLGFTRQAPVLHNGKLYMRDETEIACLDFATH